MATLAQSAFIAALTASDQLAPAERNQVRRDERQALKGDRYELWMLATAAFHQAKAASTMAGVARILRYDDVCERNAVEMAAVSAFVEIADRFMLLPLTGKNDHKERATLLRQWGTCATTVDTSPLYRSARGRWEQRLASNALREGC